MMITNIFEFVDEVYNLCLLWFLWCYIDSELSFLESSTEDPITRSTISVESKDSNQTLIPDVAIATEQLSDPDSLNTVEDIVKAILEFMETR